ncbi:MAG: M20/M25/M40 family metallo-hydrolase [Anaerolineae bacterium]|nr:MAG: M20/M25/M40 family metallo-hydrolase [Anaerolineae bacterium]
MAQSRTQALLDLALQIQQIPAPTFAEERRAAFLRERFTALSLESTQDEVGNLYVRLPGDASLPPVVLSAHLDTVFPAHTPLDATRTPERITAPGIGDNSLALAVLVHVAEAVLDGRLPVRGDLWLVANVCEEGLGNLRGMQAVVERFGSQPLAYIILEGMALGIVYHRGLGVQRFRITAQTPGGHSWANYGRPSAIHELARLAAQLDALALPQSPRTSLNVGVFQGGMSVNTIAAQAVMEVDTRSESAEMLAWLGKQINLLASRANRQNVRITVENIGLRPSGAISANHPLVKLAQQCLLEQGITPKLLTGSTDANIPLSYGYPAIGIGVTYGGNAHTLEEYIECPPLEKGVAQLESLLQRVWELV